MNSFVGAGLGGLAAAIKIALVGHKVTVLEAAPQIAEVCAHTGDLVNVRLVLGSKYLLILHDYCRDGELLGNLREIVSIPKVLFFEGIEKEIF
jgi:phytoene dehydrogenase-like protein